MIAFTIRRTFVIPLQNVTPKTTSNYFNLDDVPQQKRGEKKLNRSKRQDKKKIEEKRTAKFCEQWNITND